MNSLLNSERKLLQKRKGCMTCKDCKFKRHINLPYSHRSDDLVCCHPEIADETGRVYVGKWIERTGLDPIWCPLRDKV